MTGRNGRAPEAVDEDDEDESENQPLLAPPPAPHTSSRPPRDGTSVSTQAAGPSSSPLGSNSADATNARWLGLLFTETLLLLVLQLHLGWESGSLSLLADAPHSAVDVVTYGLAYWAEHAKLRLKSGQAPDSSFMCGRASCWQNCSPQLLDAASAGFGLLALLSATAFVAKEAMQRLRVSGEVSSDKASQAMGTALLTFSVASTVGNVGVLIMFRRWKSAALPPPPPPHPPSELQALAEAEDDEESGRRGRRAGRKRKTRLMDMGPSGGAINCQDVCCAVDKDGQASSILAAWPTLHELLHPGCAHQGFPSKDGSHGSGGHDYSLNTSSAMLHLMSDVIRGLLIFVVAILMKCHVVTNASRADAVCALLVAALVILGSGALLMEVARSLRSWRRPQDDGI